MKRLICLHTILIVLACSLITQAQTVSTLASGLGQPTGIAVDGSGNVFVSDNVARLIRKITPAGVVTVVSASIYDDPRGVSFDGSGWGYVADQSFVRKFPLAGGPSTNVAGSGWSGCNPGPTSGFGILSGIIRHPVSGVFYLGDTWCHRVWKMTPAGVVTVFAGSGLSGGIDGTGTGASFGNPLVLSFDAQDNLFVSENHRIRKITPAAVVTTYAGSGVPGFSNGIGSAAKFKFPSGIAADGQGNLFVADAGNNVIRKIAPTGAVSTYAGTGTAGSSNGAGCAATFNNPVGIALGASGILYVADRNNGMVRKITPGGHNICLSSSTSGPTTIGALATLSCTCDSWITKRITVAGSTSDLVCGGSVNLHLNSGANFNLNYECHASSGATCNAAYEALITRPDGTTQTLQITNNTNWSYTFTMAGTYTLNFKTSCDGSACSGSCAMTVVVH